MLGQENKAVPYYLKAIQRGLHAEDLLSAYVQLGSTYRTLGQYKESKETFQKGLELFPENRALQTFYAMTLYNRGEHQQAMEILLDSLIATTTDTDILRYKRAITFYKNQLDKVWQ